MRYRRALFVAELGKDAAPALAVLRRVAPGLERLLVVVELPTRAFAWLFASSPNRPVPRNTSSLTCEPSDSPNSRNRGRRSGGAL